VQRTVQQLTTLIERQLAQYAGAGVQLYSEPIIQQLIQEAFDYIFELDFWPQFRVREQRTLNGTTGVATAPFTNIKEWKDVQYVLRRYSDRPLPEIPVSFSTYDLTGTQAQWIEARNDAFLFTVYPLFATDPIEVIGRNAPANIFVLTDTVPFDDWAIVHYVAWSYFVNDASNPAAADKEQGLFDIRIKKLQEDARKGIVYLNPRSAQDIPNRWR
jgi:hypothetical protein